MRVWVLAHFEDGGKIRFMGPYSIKLFSSYTNMINYIEDTYHNKFDKPDIHPAAKHYIYFLPIDKELGPELSEWLQACEIEIL